MGKIQAHRHAVITTPLGEDVLLLRSMSASDQMGRMFRYELSLYSEKDEAIKIDKILGQNVTVKMDISPSGTRYFNGHVSRFAQVDSDGRMASYRATVVPWLWFLTRTADCRIFQGMTVPDIIKKVFRDKGFSDFEESLDGTYTPWDYCVQYRETDFNFVSRLMEQEGIYYYFKHTESKHTLVLSDSRGAHEPFPDFAKIRYRPKDQRLEDRQYVWGLALEQEVQTGAYALNDFDFVAPRKQLRATSKIPRKNSHADFEIYDYPGEYDVPGDGKSYSKIRIEEQQAAFETVRAHSDAQGICAGYTFELTHCPREDQNRELLVVAADYHIEGDEYDSNGSATAGADFTCTFRAMDPGQPFRSARLTPKPTIQGPQTAIVVGPSGDEIYTDEHGRVKVQFHWDRYGESNEKSSCWVRVSQPWAGKAWGGITIPRIGQEVIVEFLEGDPDRPIITGRVYNGDMPVPYGLPANKTQSGMKSRSSPGGSTANFNEIRMEDKKGSEQLYIHAEKNEDIIVENDKTEDVGHDETLKVGHNRDRTVGNDETSSIGANQTNSIGADRTETVGANEKITISANRTETVGANEKITIKGGRSESVAKDETIDIGKDRTETVGGNEGINIGGNRTEEVAKNESIDIKGDRTLTVDKNSSVDVKGASIVTVDKEMNVTVTKDIDVEGKKQITVTCGSAKIVMKKDGTTTIDCKDLKVTASGDVKIKGSKIAMN